MMHLDLEPDEVAIEKRRGTDEFSIASHSSVMTVLERWFTELGVAWVLRISDDDASSAGRLEQASDDDTGCRWIRALNEIVSSTTALFPVNGRLGLGTDSIPEEEEKIVKAVHVLREKKS
jgi:hypothetical protein